MSKFGISYYLGIDALSLVFILLTSILFPVCIFYTKYSIKFRSKEFMVCFLVLEALVMGVFLSLDIVLFYIFFESLLIPMFLIIGIWPILMGLTMYLQQKLNPAPADPIQSKIFAFFPLFLTIILAPFTSGLVVYWTINNILTIAQQWVIMRKTKVKTV